MSLLKKFAAMAMVAVMAVGMTACGGGKKDDGAAELLAEYQWKCHCAAVCGYGQYSDPQ